MMLFISSFHTSPGFYRRETCLPQEFAAQLCGFLTKNNRCQQLSSRWRTFFFHIENRVGEWGENEWGLRTSKIVGGFEAERPHQLSRNLLLGTKTKCRETPWGLALTSAIDGVCTFHPAVRLLTSWSFWSFKVSPCQRQHLPRWLQSEAAVS